MLTTTVWLRLAQVAAWLLALAFVAPWLITAYLTARSMRGLGFDPHRYMMIFGTILLVLLGLPATVAVAAAIGTSRRRRAGAWGSVALGVALVAICSFLAFQEPKALGNISVPLGLAALPAISAILALAALFAVPKQDPTRDSPYRQP